MRKKYFLVLFVLLFGFVHHSFGQNALSLDGTNDYISTAQPGPGGNSSRTVEAWIKTSYSGATQGVLVDWGAVSPNGSRFTFNVLNGLLRIEIAGSGFNSTLSIANGAWHHVAVTYNNSNATGQKAKLYIDGVLNASADFTTSMNTLSTTGIRIGARVDGISFFNGSIDEVRIWNTERTAAQILAGKDAEFCYVPAGLIAYFKCNQGIAGGANTGISNLTNAANATFNGTFHGLALSGASSNFVAGPTTLAAAGTTSSTIAVTACASYTSPANHVYTATGVYHDTIPNSAGCDSLITINLTIGVSAPAGLTASSITSSGANLSWTAVSGATSYQYVLDQSASNPVAAGTATTNNSYAATALASSTVYYMHVRATCGSGFSSWSTVSFTTLCSAPSISKTDSFNCGPGSVTLEATSSTGASLKWYSAATGGTNIGSGNTFITPVLTATTDFYVEASQLSSLGQIGRNDYTGISQAIPNNTGQGIQFNALTNFNLDSVSVWVTTDTGKIIVQLQNAANTPLQTNTFTFSGTGATATSRVKIYLPVNYSIATGNNYKILALNGTTVPLSREGSITPPFSTYSINNVIAMVASWVNGAQGTSNYYYFYNLYISSGCISPRQVVTASILPKPVINLGNDTTICPGVSYTLNAGNTGAVYLWSTGDITQAITTNAAASYNVKVTLNNCVNSDTIIVTPGITPVNIMADSTNLCDGDVVVLNAGNAGCTYSWAPGGAVTQSINAGTEGSYTVIIKSMDGCEVNSATFVKIRPLPIASLGNDTTICATQTIVLDAGNPGYSYSWNTGAGTQTTNSNDSGEYMVTITTPYNCILADSTHIAYFPSPRTEGFNFIPRFFEALGKVEFSPLNPTDVIGYEWDFGDSSPLVAIMNPLHVYTASGEYEVTLKVYNDCADYTVRQKIHVDLPTGIVTLDGSNIQPDIYPNPAKSILNISNNNPEYKMEDIIIFNTTGSIIYHQKSDSETAHQLSVEGFSSGIYFIRILMDKGFAYKQIQVIK